MRARPLRNTVRSPAMAARSRGTVVYYFSSIKPVIGKIDESQLVVEPLSFDGDPLYFDDEQLVMTVPP